MHPSVVVVPMGLRDGRARRTRPVPELVDQVLERVGPLLRLPQRAGE